MIRNRQNSIGNDYNAPTLRLGIPQTAKDRMPSPDETTALYASTIGSCRRGLFIIKTSNAEPYTVKVHTNLNPKTEKSNII